MKIDQLIYFTETARLEHIGKASKVLGISTSAISHSISSLEGELGYDLFEKKGKNIVLTEQGRNLLNRSQELINQFQNLKQSLLGANTERMHLKVAASHRLAHGAVAQAWAELSPKYPQVTLELVTDRSSEVIQSVLNREMDFGICFSPQSHPDLEMREVFRGELLVTVRADHPVLKLPESQRLSALSAYPAILPKAAQGVELCISHPMFAKNSLVPRAVTLADSYDVSLELITQTDGWGFTVDVLLDSRVKGLKTKTGWNAPYHVSVIHLRKKFMPKFFADFEETLSAILRQTADGGRKSKKSPKR